MSTATFCETELLSVIWIIMWQMTPSPFLTSSPSSPSTLLLFLLVTSGLQTDEGLHLMELLARRAKIQMTDVAELSYVFFSFLSPFVLVEEVRTENHHLTYSWSFFSGFKTIHLSNWVVEYQKKTYKPAHLLCFLTIWIIDCYWDYWSVCTFSA